MINFDPTDYVLAKLGGPASEKWDALTLFYKKTLTSVAQTLGIALPIERISVAPFMCPITWQFNPGASVGAIDQYFDIGNTQQGNIPNPAVYLPRTFYHGHLNLVSFVTAGVAGNSYKNGLLLTPPTTVLNFDYRLRILAAAGADAQYHSPASTATTFTDFNDEFDDIMFSLLHVQTNQAVANSIVVQTLGYFSGLRIDYN